MRDDAWMRTEGRLAIVCAWCATKTEAETQAAAAGLEVSHGICPACAGRMMPAARGEITPDAVTPEMPAGADWALDVDWWPVASWAAVCGVDGFELMSTLRPAHWVLGRHFRADPAGFAVLIGATPDWVGELSASGRGEAARRLWCWLVARAERKAQRENFAAGSDETAPVTQRRGNHRRTLVAPARTSADEGGAA